MRDAHLPSCLRSRLFTTTALEGWLLVCVLAFPARVEAGSILLNPPPGWNGMIISARVIAGWFDSSGPLSDLLDSTSALFVVGEPFPPRVPGEEITGTSLSLSHLPDSGRPKDKAEIRLDYSIVVGDGTPSSSDSFSFRLRGTTSAVDAKQDFGAGLVPANAYVGAEIEIMIPAPVPVVSGARFGVPALPTLTTPPPHLENLTAQGSVGPFGGPPRETWTMRDGDAGFSVPFSLDPFRTEQLRYSLAYNLYTPYGTDPTIDLTIQGTLSAVPVPEPATGVLVALGLGCGACMRRYRRRAATSQE